jgi:hypothetical protein
MISRPPDLPDFGAPPVTEVALGVQFNSLDRLLAPHLGIIWVAALIILTTARFGESATDRKRKRRVAGLAATIREAFGEGQVDPQFATEA